MIDSLEPRVLFAFAANINFQPAGAATPSGYVADTGLTYAARSASLTYGWSTSNTANTRDRNDKTSADQRYDTLAYLKKTTAFKWEIAVPNGQYSVRVVEGDAWPTAIHAIVNVEGKAAVDLTHSSTVRWSDITITATVTDGRLTITPGSAAGDTKLCFIEVKSIAAPQYDTALMNQIAGVFTIAQASANRTLTEIGNSAAAYPLSTRADGTWEVTDNTKWTSGFGPGVMWQLQAYTGSSTWLSNAKKWTTPLATQTQKQGDLAFRFMTSYLPLYQQTKSAADRDVLLKAAAAKNAMWNETVGAFQTTWYVSHSGNSKANFAVLMDMTVDLQLMIWAGQQTGNQQYIDRALRHFQLVSKYLVAADGGTRHLALFDKATGAFQGNETYQGYSDTSTWGRGQAWAILSFAGMAKDTGRADVLSSARKVADFYLAHMPTDGVTYWDFNDPKIPNTFRDSSAAAVAADGMLQIAKLISDPAASAIYRKGAEKILKSLIANDLITNPNTQRGLLRHGALDVPHKPESNDVSLIFGDYYFLDAMNRYRTFA
ncbi:MAG: alpha2C2-mannosidase [Phycisphaerales bacterium]|nr:alpha2C2-mannosidase [Phycisphaerales bacterium]